MARNPSPSNSEQIPEPARPANYAVARSTSNDDGLNTIDSYARLLGRDALGCVAAAILLIAGGASCSAQQAGPMVSAGTKEMERLAPLIGTWDGTFTAPATQFTAAQTAPFTASFRWVLNNCHLAGSLNYVIDGRPYEAQILISYDWNAKQHIAHWVDNASTQALTYHGNFTDARNLTLRASHKQDGQVVNHRIRLRLEPSGGWEMASGTDVSGDMSDLVMLRGHKKK